MVKIVATSDFHGHLPEIPDCDILLVAGDICPANNHKVEFQRKWIKEKFEPWLRAVHAKHKIVTLGNHDFFGDVRGGPDAINGCNLLLDRMTTVEGLKIWGCPHTGEFFDWAFMMNEAVLFNHHSLIPYADIVVTHGPPFGFGDRVPRGNGFENVGSKALTQYIVKHEPKLVVFGHIHCDQGCRKLGHTLIANVSYVNEKYKPYCAPSVFEIEV